MQRVKVFDESETKTVILESPQKGRRALRRIHLPAGLTQKLREYGEGMPDGFYILSGSVKPVEPRRPRVWLEKAEREAGFEIAYRTLRRTYASQCIESCGEDTLSQLLGHSRTLITRRMLGYSAIEQGTGVAIEIGNGAKVDSIIGRFILRIACARNCDRSI